MSSALDNTYGAALIGVIFASFLLGLSALQAFIYFSQQTDTRAIRTLVGCVVFFDFVHQALISHTVYHYLITNYGIPSALGTVVWSLLVEVIFNGCTAFLVQGFLTWRIYRLSDKNIWLTGAVSTLVFAEFGCVTTFGILSLVRVRTFAELASELTGLSVTVNALAAAGDVIIAGILSYLLQGSKTGFGRSDSMLNKLTLFAVNTGALTSLCAVASLISILAAPDTFIYISFFFAMGRLYTNSLLATLNARKMIRNCGENIQTTSDLPLSSFGKSFNPKKFRTPAEISIQVETTKEAKGDYEPYDLSNQCDGGSNVTLPSPVHFSEV